MKQNLPLDLRQPRSRHTVDPESRFGAVGLQCSVNHA